MASKVIIFRFNRNGETDITPLLKNGAHQISIDKNRFTIKDFKMTEGGDESICYSATLCINGKAICTCRNEGNGGMTDLEPMDMRTKALLAAATLRVGSVKCVYGNLRFTLSIDKIADFLAETAANDWRERNISLSTHCKLKQI